MRLSTKVAFLFPGQGSQRVGMGKDLWLNCDSAREVFDEADQILGLPLSRLCFEGPEDELIQTQNVQPAVLTVSVACLKATQEMYGTALLQPAFVSGHSLGEYTALVAAGSISFADALRLVRVRGQLMNEASKQYPGGMLAILSLDEQAVREVCQAADVEISNINSPEQIVISGAEEKLVKAKELAIAMGARRVIPLKVSGAFHSKLMTRAAEGLKRAIQETTINDPIVPLVANTSGKILTRATEIRQELLEQLTQCVRWLDCIRTILHAGTTLFFEIGPGEVLAGLLRRIDPSAQIYNISNLEDLVRLADVLEKTQYGGNSGH